VQAQKSPPYKLHIWFLPTLKANARKTKNSILDNLYTKIKNTVELIENDEIEKAFQMYYLEAKKLEKMLPAANNVYKK
jgi:hypothetical protein